MISLNLDAGKQAANKQDMKDIWIHVHIYGNTAYRI